MDSWLAIVQIVQRGRMGRFWWVNHKQTFTQEHKGGYLWSPKREVNNARSQFYDNMRRARRGDGVLSYADGRIRAIGEVTDEALEAAKPADFGNIGEYWAHTGWLLPVSWRDVVNEVKPSAHLSVIAPLLPKKYSPLRSKNGRGNQKAYLAEISEDLYLALGALASGTIGDGVPPADRFAVIDEYEQAQVQALQSDLTLSETVLRTLMDARLGQGEFRARLLASDKACAVTGVRDARLLRAGHIKPWRLCQNAGERLSELNGILLVPTLDHLFDRGLMTFGQDGLAKFSSSFNAADLVSLKLNHARSGYSLSHHEEFLEFHRSEVFVV
jgi:putative restriction endonuclease